jgi:hypothetical protein
MNWTVFIKMIIIDGNPYIWWFITCKSNTL